MPNKSSRAQSKITLGTIGSRPCEISLNKILVDINDAAITHKALSLYDAYKRGVKKLTVLFENDKDKHYYRTFMTMWLHRFQDAAKKKVIPEHVFTHLLCCLKAEYKTAIRALKT